MLLFLQSLPVHYARSVSPGEIESLLLQVGVQASLDVLQKQVRLLQTSQHVGLTRGHQHMCVLDLQTDRHTHARTHTHTQEPHKPDTSAVRFFYDSLRGILGSLIFAHTLVHPLPLWSRGHAPPILPNCPLSATTQPLPTDTSADLSSSHTALKSHGRPNRGTILIPFLFFFGSSRFVLVHVHKGSQG